MELRSAEQEVDELRLLYTSIREQRVDLNEYLPPLGQSTGSICAASVSAEDRGASREVGDVVTSGSLNAGSKTGSTRNDVADGSLRDAPPSHLVLKQLEAIAERLSKDLKSKVERFGQRMNERDAVTGQPRYGIKTMDRVRILLERYEELNQIMEKVVHSNESTGDGHITPGASETNVANQSLSVPPLDYIRQLAKEELEEGYRLAQAERERLATMEAEQKAEESRRIEQERLTEEMERNRVERERLERARQIDEVRALRLRAQQDAARSDREWVASITKGAEGVRDQLQKLLAATASDPQAQLVALQSLYTIFSQIASHPEESNFRRIRRDHPKFNQDIGRHPGGRELLIAAGFELGTVDDTPSFICKEPDIERNMDAWSAWFDLLIATVTVIEEQMKK